MTLSFLRIIIAEFNITMEVINKNYKFIKEILHFNMEIMAILVQNFIFLSSLIWIFLNLSLRSHFYFNFIKEVNSEEFWYSYENFGSCLTVFGFYIEILDLRIYFAFLIWIYFLFILFSLMMIIVILIEHCIFKKIYHWLKQNHSNLMSIYLNY